MPIRPIRSSEDLDAALARAEALWDAAPGTPDGDELDVLLTLIEAYEAAHHAIPPGDPVEVLQYKLAELGLSQNALARRLGWSSGRVSEVLNRKRPLTLAMIRALAEALTLPPGALVGAESAAATDRIPVWLPAALCDRIRASLKPGHADLESAVLLLIERGLGAPAPARPAQTSGSSSQATRDLFCLRPDALRSLHSRLAA